MFLVNRLYLSLWLESMLNDITFQLWKDLERLCSFVKLESKEDSCNWVLTESGIFSVKSFYEALISQKCKFPFREF